MQVLSKELKEHGYYKKKGVIDKLASKFVGQVAMLDSGDILQVRVYSLGTECRAVQFLWERRWPTSVSACMRLPA